MPEAGATRVRGREEAVAPLEEKEGGVMSRLVRYPSPVGDDKAGTQQGVLWSTLLTVFFFLQTATSSQAFTINNVGISGGNPGRLPVYEVAGLVQGDSFTVT
jgi:hypothetical protein